MSATPNRGRMHPLTAAMLHYIGHCGSRTNIEVLDAICGPGWGRTERQRLINMRYSAYLNSERKHGEYILRRTTVMVPDVPLPIELVTRLANLGVPVHDLTIEHPKEVGLPTDAAALAAARRLDAKRAAKAAKLAAQDDDADDDLPPVPAAPRKPQPRDPVPAVLEAVAATPARHVVTSALASNRPPVVRAGSLDALRLASRQFGTSHHHHAAASLGVVEAGAAA